MARTRPLLVLVLVLLLLVPVALTSTAAAGTRRTTATAKAGSCAGFKNRPGMTRKVIRIGNVVDKSGPVPDLYLSARQAVRAYVAYFNANHRICGRRLVVDRLDSRTDATADRAAAKAMCANDFAAVGSMSVFDGGGAATTQGCGLPDLRATASTSARNGCSTCFGVEAWRSGVGANSVPDYFVAHDPAAVQKAAILSMNVAAVSARAATLEKVDQARGFTYVYSASIDVAEFNYKPYAQQMKNQGVRLVRFIGTPQQAARLALAMNDVGFAPDVFLAGASAYGPAYVASAGAAGEGTVVPIDFVPLNGDQTQLRLYRAWLAKVVPGARPTPEGLFAWSAAKLFTKEAVSLGGKLSRRSLVARLRTVTGWTGGGLHAPMAVGGKQVSPCTRLLRLHAGQWIPLGGTAYRCSGLTKVG